MPVEAATVAVVVVVVVVADGIGGVGTRSALGSIGGVEVWLGVRGPCVWSVASPLPSLLLLLSLVARLARWK